MPVPEGKKISRPASNVKPPVVGTEVSDPFLRAMEVPATVMAPDDTVLNVPPLTSWTFVEEALASRETDPVSLKTTLLPAGAEKKTFAVRACIVPSSLTSVASVETFNVPAVPLVNKTDPPPD